MQGVPTFALPSRRRRMLLSLAPLIDVTFILLIFFMLVTQFTRFVPVDVTLSRITQAAPPLTPGSASVKAQSRLTVGADGAIALDGQTISSLAKLGEAIRRRGLERQRQVESTEKPALVIAPESGVDLQLLIDVLTAAQDTSAFAIRIAVPLGHNRGRLMIEGGP